MPRLSSRPKRARSPHSPTATRRRYRRALKRRRPTTLGEKDWNWPQTASDGFMHCHLFLLSHVCCQLNIKRHAHKVLYYCHLVSSLIKSCRVSFWMKTFWSGPANWGWGWGGVGGNVGEKINQFCDLPRPKETNQPGTVIDVMTFTCPVDRFSELHLPLGTGLLPFCHRWWLETESSIHQPASQGRVHCHGRNFWLGSDGKWGWK